MSNDEIQQMIQEGIEAHLAQTRASRHVDFSGLDRGAMKDLIEHIGSDSTFGAGKNFLLTLLQHSDVAGLEAFMHRMEDVIDDKQRQIVPEIDFTKHELAIYRASKVRMGTLDRRQLNKMLAGSIGAVVGTAAIAAPVVINSVELHEEMTDDKPADAREWALRAGGSTVSVASGTVTLARSFEHINRMRVAQVVNAISELAVYAGPVPGEKDSPLAHLSSGIKEQPGLLTRILTGRRGIDPDAEPSKGR